MKLQDILTEKNSSVAHSTAYAQGATDAEHFLQSHGMHKGKEHPKCKYGENSEEWRAWHEGFKVTVNTSTWYDGDD